MRLPVTGWLPALQINPHCESDVSRFVNSMKVHYGLYLEYIRMLAFISSLFVALLCAVGLILCSLNHKAGHASVCATCSATGLWCAVQMVYPSRSLMLRTSVGAVLACALVSQVWLSDPLPSELLAGCAFLLATLFGLLGVDADQLRNDENAPDSDLRLRRGRRWVCGLVLLGFFVYMVLVPALGQLIARLQPGATSFSRELTDMTQLETLRLHSVSGVVMCLFLAMGASIGSFLNVVIFRLPRGRKLLHPPSSCSRCNQRIAAKDNIPIISWISLGGRCRSCHVALSPRYPIVEASVAAIFVFLYYLELLSGGANLPVREPNMYHGIVWILLYTKWDLVSIYFFHCFVCVLLLAWGMINWDRFQVPRRNILTVVGVSLALVNLAPHLNPARSDLGMVSLTEYESITTSVVGCLVGCLSGLLLQYFFRMPLRASQLSSLREPAAVEPDCNLATEAECESRQVSTNEQASEASDLSSVSVDSQPTALYGEMAQSPIQTADACASFALLGVAFGPSPVAAIALSCAGAMVLLRFASPSYSILRAIPVTLLASVVTVLNLSFWRQLAGFAQSWPAPLNHCVALLVVVLSLVSMWLAAAYAMQYLAGMGRRQSASPWTVSDELQA